MKLAVISDIHSNFMALENALCMIDKLKPDGIIFLGDYLTDFPYPQRTLWLLDECRATFPCWFVRGNREDYMLRHRENPDDGWRHSSSSGSLLYTFENLAPCDLDRFQAMPAHIDIYPDRELGFDGVPPLTACHGSPRATKEWIMNRPALIDHYLSEVEGKVLLCGHTHRAGVAEGHGKRLIFCPSVGLPHDVNPGAKFLMLEPRGGIWRYRTYVVDYDKRRMEREFYRSGLAEKSGVWAKCIIRDMYEERDNAARCVALAWRIAASERFDGSSVLPEEYWERAAKELRLI